MNKIFDEQRIKIPQKAFEKKIHIDDETVYNLREQGKTYKQIASYFVNKGIKISETFISKRCKLIYEEKGKVEPTITDVYVSDKMLEELIELGFNYSQISRYLAEMNITISVSKVSERCKEIYGRKGIPIPKVKRGWKPLGAVVINYKAVQLALENLRSSRKATEGQLKILAKQYNIQWDYAINLDEVDNSYEER